jgi:putative flippase GtrA
VLYRFKGIFKVGSPIRFLMIGAIGMIINLLSFSFYLNIFKPTTSSFFAFSTAVLFNFIGHKIFLWEIKERIPFLKFFFNFYLGYSLSLVVNLLCVFYFEFYFVNKIYIQVIGIICGSVINYFVSKAIFNKKSIN